MNKRIQEMNKHFNNEENEPKKEEIKIEITENKKIASIPNVPSVPNVPKVPSVPGVPNVPKVPSVPGVPNVPNVPKVPSAPKIPSVPKVPNAPKSLINKTSSDESENLSLSEQIAKGITLKKVDPPKPMPRASTTSDDKMGNMMEEMKKIQLKKMNK
jgi:hypothetical protein